MRQADRIIDRIREDVRTMQGCETLEELTETYTLIVGREPDDDAAGSVERIREDLDDYLTTECAAYGIHCATVGLR